MATNDLKGRTNSEDMTTAMGQDEMGMMRATMTFNEGNRKSIIYQLDDES